MKTVSVEMHLTKGVKIFLMRLMGVLLFAFGVWALPYGCVMMDQITDTFRSIRGFELLFLSLGAMGGGFMAVAVAHDLDWKESS